MIEKRPEQSLTSSRQEKKFFPNWLRWLFICSILLIIIGVTLSTLIFPTQNWVGFVSIAVGALGALFTFIPLAQTILAPAKTDIAEVRPSVDPSLENQTQGDAPQLRGGNPANIPSAQRANESANADITVTLSPTSSPVPLVQPGDIFFFNESLPRTNEFYGRDAERITVMNRLMHRASTSIVGPRRMGKTWLLDYVRLTEQENHDDYISVGYIDTTMPDFSVARFTIKAVNALADVPYDGTSNISLRILLSMVEQMKARKQIPVLCIDEFEGFGKVAEFDINFFTHLRAIAQVGLVLITASKTPLIEIVGDSGKTSGFFNIFEQLTLDPFNEVEAQHFADAKSQQAGFTADERQRLLHHGKIGEQQWHPLRMQLTGKMLLTDKILAASGNPARYRPKELDYWQKFEQQLEEKYRGVVRS